MVWIHGGGDAGSARLDDPNSRAGDRLAASQNVLVCLLEFRQGIFGTMDWGSGSDVPTNLELRDMICGLQWIRDNIAAFGGDAGNVTIVGESIGARRVCELVWCPAAKGLFHRAIASSPSGLHVRGFVVVVCRFLRLLHAVLPFWGTHGIENEARQDACRNQRVGDMCLTVLLF